MRIDPRLYLIRVERADWPCSLRGHSFQEMESQVEALRRGDGAARSFLQGLCDLWNAERDKRPVYVTPEIQVEDILRDGVEDWAVRLRNRLGLGHLDPGVAGRPAEVLVMRYTVDEILQTLGDQGYPAVPTVLDGEISPFFYPSPVPRPGSRDVPPYGRTVNLTAIDSENDYEVGYEVLHPRIEYRPEHFYRCGIIDEPVNMPLPRARRFHLSWVRLYAERDEFGADLFGSSQP